MVKVTIAVILCVLLGALFYQLYAPGSKYNYWKCSKGTIEGHDFWFTFVTVDKQVNSKYIDLNLLMFISIQCALPVTTRAL